MRTALFTIVLLNLAWGSSDGKEIVLSDNCPPGFERIEQNICKLRSLYQFYDSTQNRGVGGTRTGLPEYRDGFRAEQIDLGRYLFFDPILSGNNDLSCASCHDPQHGFSDARAVSTGANGEKTRRSAPSLWNMAFLPYFFWDARAPTLEQQAQGPLFSPIEMNSQPAQLLAKLNNSSAYRAVFAQAFPDQTGNIKLTQVYTALAAFQSSLISLNSRYDRYAHGDHNALTQAEIAGMNVFRSFVARCAECHTPPLFTNNQIAVIGTPEPEGHSFDIGAETTFDTSKLRGGFKVPTLRNIALTAPYMHSGRFKTLKDAARFYTKGRGHAVPENEELLIHWHVWEPNLQASELDAIVRFLHTLTDTSFSPPIPTHVPSGLTPVIGVK